MVSFYLRKMRSIAIMAAAVSCFATSEKLVAASTVTYTASGTFSSLISGNDLFELNGEPFSFSVSPSTTAVPSKHGTNYAAYNGLPMMATVTSGLIGTPITLTNQVTSMVLAIGGTGDLFEAVTPITITASVKLNIKVLISLPLGTITRLHVYPFAAPVALTPATATLTYTDGTATTVLGMTGTVNATLSGGAAATDAGAAKSSPVFLHETGAQTITRHADGTQSVRSAHGSAVDLGAGADKVTLQFYASGVRGGSQVNMQIAGEDVRVLYAGPAGHFAGLDQVSVQLPRSLAGRGDADAVLTVDGRTSSPVRIHIQ